MLIYLWISTTYYLSHITFYYEPQDLTPVVSPFNASLFQMCIASLSRLPHLWSSPKCFGLRFFLEINCCNYVCIGGSFSLDNIGTTRISVIDTNGAEYMDYSGPTSCHNSWNAKLQHPTNPLFVVIFYDGPPTVFFEFQKNLIHIKIFAFTLETSEQCLRLILA